MKTNLKVEKLTILEIIISINFSSCFFGSVLGSIIWYSLVLLLTLKTFPLFTKNVS